jgi:hypothetical protein
MKSFWATTFREEPIKQWCVYKGSDVVTILTSSHVQPSLLAGFTRSRCGSIKFRSDAVLASLCLFDFDLPPSVNSRGTAENIPRISVIVSYNKISKPLFNGNLAERLWLVTKMTHFIPRSHTNIWPIGASFRLTWFQYTGSKERGFEVSCISILL